jgi:hypothetical protein
MKLSDISHGVFGKKPKKGEIWILKDDKQIKVKIKSVNSNNVKYYSSDLNNPSSIGVIDTDIKTFRYMYTMESKK